MNKKIFTIILIILAILAIAVTFILFNKTKAHDIYSEDNFLNPQNQNLNQDDNFEKEFKKGDISPKLLDDEQFNNYISQITENLIDIETTLTESMIDEVYDSNLQMDVKAYIDKESLIKIDTSDGSMRFEIYYFKYEPIFILATPAEFAGQKTPDGSYIGYRMFFKENVMLQAMDLDGRPINPDSDDFKEMEDFSARLAFYFMQQYK